MNVLKSALVLSCLAGAAAMHVSADAALFYEDFESPAIADATVTPLVGTGWTTSGGTIWRPGAASDDPGPGQRWNQAEPMAGPAGGNQILFLNNGQAANNDTGIVIQANTVYTLSAAVGWDIALTTHGAWSIQLFADKSTVTFDPGEVFLGQTYSNGDETVTSAVFNNPTQGNWALNSVTWDSASNPGLVGSTLSVYVNNFGSTDTVYFDNIEITAVPEPGSLALLGLGGLLIARRRRA